MPMTSLERSLLVLKHQIPDRVPVMLYDAPVAARLAGYDMIEFSKDARKQAASHLQAQEQIGYDGIIVGCDAVVMAEAIGAEVDYPVDSPPRHMAGCLGSTKDYRKLRKIDPWKDGRLPVWLEAVRIVVEKKGREVFIMGRGDQGPFSLACMVRGIDDFLMEIATGEDLDSILGLMRYCKECAVEFMKAMKSVGAHITSIGDSLSGPDLISPKMYEKFVFPLHRELAADCRKMGIPLSIHICGKTDAILDTWVNSGAEMIEIDHKTDLAAALQRTRNKTCILGNIDTSEVLSRGTTRDVELAAEQVLRLVMPKGDFFLNAGCLIARETPADNLKALVEVAKRRGVYAQA